MSGQPRELTRRRLFSEAGLLAAATLVGCKERAERELTCLPDAKLPEPEMKARTAVEYVERGPDASRHCDVCQHWQPGKSEDVCGGCAVLRGPIHPRGTCRVFTKRA